MRPRAVPVVLLRDGYVVKTRRYDRPRYVGDPINTVKLFNEKGVDELVLLDIDAGARGIDYNLLSDIATEAFMPLVYGGGLRTIQEAQRILTLGFEKVAFNTALIEDPAVLTRVARDYGAQAVVASIDVGRPRARRLQRRPLLPQVLGGGHTATGLDAVGLARTAEEAGAGEILLTAADREGDRGGYDLDLIARVSSAVSIPVIAHGGAGIIDHFPLAIAAGASAAAAGTMFTHYGPHRAVLITYPSDAALTDVFNGQEVTR